MSISLVTGANGHVGYNLVRHLLAKGERVRAGIRNSTHKDLFRGLSCEVVHADLSDPDSLAAALQGVDVLYQVAAVFKRWAKNPELEIIRANVDGTRNILKAAVDAGVRKVVYVSSMTALDFSQAVIKPSWNPVPRNPYEISKLESERLALGLAAELRLDLSTILPAAIIGPVIPALGESASLFKSILEGQLPFDPNFNIPFIDVRDLAEACHRAAMYGKTGQRYIVSHQTLTPTGEVIRLAARLYPERNIKPGRKMPRRMMLAIASMSEAVGKLTGKAPMMEREVVRTYCDAHFTVDTRATQDDLQLSALRPIQRSLEDTFKEVSTKFVGATGR